MRTIRNDDGLYAAEELWLDPDYDPHKKNSDERIAEKIDEAFARRYADE